MCEVCIVTQPIVARRISEIQFVSGGRSFNIISMFPFSCSVGVAAQPGIQLIIHRYRHHLNQSQEFSLYLRDANSAIIFPSKFRHLNNPTYSSWTISRAIPMPHRLHLNSAWGYIVATIAFNRAGMSCFSEIPAPLQSTRAATSGLSSLSP